MEWKAANILFADVKGYSALTDNGMKIFHEKVLASLNETLTGIEIRDRNTWGDGIVFLGDKISEICEAALLLRDKFKQINWKKLGISKLDIRISVHHGEYLEGNDPFTGRSAFCGKTVVTAARIEPVTPPGVIWMTNVAATLLHQHIASADDDFFAVDEIGTVTLPKGHGQIGISALRRKSESALSDSDLQAIRDAEQIRLAQAADGKSNIPPEKDIDNFCILVGVVSDGDRVLLVQRRPNDEDLDWMFPSGKKFPTDDLKYSIQKEVLEETGVHCTYRKKISEVASHPITKHRCQYIFLEPHVQDEAINGDPMENQKVEWVSIDEAIRRIGSKLNGKVLDFLKALQEGV